jgi:hypothetical protein
VRSVRRRVEDVSRRNFIFIVVTEFVVDGWKSTQFETGDVSEDGGATNRDAVFDGEAGDGAEELVYFGGGPEIEWVRSEVAGEVRFEVGFELVVDVAEAEFRAGQDRKAAAATGVVEVTTYGARQDGVGLRHGWLRFHFGPLVGVRLGVSPHVFAKSVEAV